MLYFFMYDVKVWQLVKTLHLTVTVFSAEVFLPFCIMQYQLIYANLFCVEFYQFSLESRKFYGQKDLEKPGVCLKCVAPCPRSSFQHWLNGALLVRCLICCFWQCQGSHSDAKCISRSRPDGCHCCRNECNVGAAIWKVDSFTWKFLWWSFECVYVHQRIYSTLP